MLALGIDIGGTGIKGAVVDTARGSCTGARYRLETPLPATPHAVTSTVKKLVTHFKWKGPIGITLPSVVKRGVVLTASNIDSSWIGKDAAQLFRKALKQSVTVLNDADAAGVAEANFGAGAAFRGVVLLITLGTGIGSALLYNGTLIPNSEFGHLEVRGKDAEKRASNRVRESKDLSWKRWSKNVDEYLRSIEALIWPDLIIIGGGVSKKHKKFLPQLTTRAKVVPAKLLNEAGIVGAALEAVRPLKEVISQ